MKERPILFSAPMVRAILAGTKTQTRRVVTPQPEPTMSIQGVTRESYWYPPAKAFDGTHFASEKHLRKGLPIDFCRYGAPGDRLWVRETWGPCDGGFCYRADEPNVIPDADGGNLEREARGLERLREITEAEIRAEGFDGHVEKGVAEADFWLSPQSEFQILWNELNYARGFGWDVNPWVWVVSFKSLHRKFKTLHSKKVQLPAKTRYASAEASRR